MKVLKNKAKAKTNQNMVSVPEAKAEVVQAEPIEKAEPCVIFRDNVGVPSMDDHESMSESIQGSLRITVNGYDEEETRRRKSPSRNHVRDILVASTLRSRKIAAHSANCSGCSVVNRRSEPPRPIRSSISA